MTAEAIALGLALSLFFSETLGLATGGMVVPGYVAMHMHQPARLLGTLVVALCTLGAIRLLSNHAFIYGRRRTVVVLLIGFLLGRLSDRLLRFDLPGRFIDASSVGYIIPGLIADWMERQGLIETLSTLAVAATLVRLLLIVFSGGTAAF